MKKLMRIVLTTVIVLMASTLPTHADRGRGWHGGGGHEHGGGHFNVGVAVGSGWWGPGWWGWDPYPYYPYPYYPYYPYYPQTPVVVQQSPDVYVQQPAPRTEESQYWYFCPDPQGYYPYVKRCPKGWLKVVPPQRPPEGEEE